MLSPLLNDITDHKGSQTENDTTDKDERKIVFDKGNVSEKMSG